MLDLRAPLARSTVRHMPRVEAPSVVEADDEACTEALVRAISLLEDHEVSWPAVS